MKYLVALALLALVAVVSADRCPDTCVRRVRQTYRCGSWGWRRCSRYVTRYVSCYKDCVHGQWSAYSMHSETPCNKPCAVGTKSVLLKRTCTNPTPRGKGRQCVGQNSYRRTEYCNQQPCPVDGGWSGFLRGTVGACSTTCGGGARNVTYVRTCTNPVARYGGRACVGDSTEVRLESCNTNPCPVHGGWSDWSEWEDYDECTALCGNGTKVQYKNRTCDDPAPMYGGDYCSGPEKKDRTIHCRENDCGDKCPENQVTYLAHETNQSRYYQCTNDMARLMSCAPGTKWNQNSTTCVNIQEEVVVVTVAPECDASMRSAPNDDCTQYSRCENSRIVYMSCSPGTLFDEGLQLCNHAATVTCNASG